MLGKEEESVSEQMNDVLAQVSYQHLIFLYLHVSGHCQVDK